mgnify:CR=1 FL=1
MQDYNGNSFECLSCIFGDEERDWAVSAIPVDSTTMRCPVPPHAALNTRDEYVRFGISINFQNFYYTDAKFKYGLDVDDGSVEKVIFAADLSQAEVVPPTGSPALGEASLHYDPDTNSLSWEVTHDVQNPISAEIRQGAPGENGPVVFDLGK